MQSNAGVNKQCFIECENCHSGVVNDQLCIILKTVMMFLIYAHTDHVALVSNLRAAVIVNLHQAR